MYKDKIVVIGASNPSRRDRHYTPFGDMAGSEVVINAIRSFLIYDSQDKSPWDLIKRELVIVSAWFGRSFNDRSKLARAAWACPNAWSTTPWLFSASTWSGLSVSARA